MKIKFKSDSEEQTRQIAEKIAKSCFAPCVISLSGDLGAGKTTFTKGFAKGLGITDTITSPTFTLLNTYEYGKKLHLNHFDMYRLSSKEEAMELGFEEYFDLRLLEGFTIVEWAENVKGLLPEKHIEITIKKISEEKREIIMEYRGII